MPFLDNLQQNLLKDGQTDYQFQLAEKGVSGTYFVKNKDGYIAVFKDAAEDALSVSSPRIQPKLNRFFSWLLARIFKLFTGKKNSLLGQSYVADITASKVFKKIQEHSYFQNISIPEAIKIENLLIQNKSRKGSLMTWVDNQGSLESHASLLFKQVTRVPKDIKPIAFQEMAVMDYIMGGMDRKPDNVLIGKDHKLHLIDCSWSFSEKQGEQLSKNMFHWGTWPVLKEKQASEEIKLMIKHIYDCRDELARIVLETYHSENPPDETDDISYNRAMCFLHRIEMLYALMYEKNKTFHDLSQMKYESQFIDSRIALSSELTSATPFMLQTDSAKRYRLIFSRSDDQTPSLYNTLLAETRRINKELCILGPKGLWREAYAEKVQSLNQQVSDLERDTEREKKIKEAFQEKNGPLYHAMNQHASLFFNVNFTDRSFKTHGALVMERAVSDLA